MTDASYNDRPITEPKGDLYRLDPFAQALAASIRKMVSPEGTVLALNGPWGSGKSSTVNLVKHHLQAAVEAGELVLLDFKPWWFKGDDALALAFFRELYAGMGPSLGEKFKKVLPKLGARVLQSGSLVAEGLAFAGMSAIGKLISSGMQTAVGLIGNNSDTVDHLHRELSQSLREQSKRFLIVIDDIDRLTPDEALMIFRLVKSVGHLPNVIYLLVFDRALAEKIASDRFPSEGPQYLEKIIQVSFDLPPAQATDLQ
ncbi:MAG: AAA family ATPase, partial [Rhodospirillales bacterium]|nr:AAA family ATPase [Rhodospirillales bacterium]